MTGDSHAAYRDGFSRRDQFGDCMIRIVAIVVALLVTVLPFEAQQRPHVLMISVDGLKPSTYTRPAPPNAPNIRKLAAEGSVADGLIGVLPTVTYPSHTSLVTGVVPAVHGIVDNRILDPEGRSRGAWFWYSREMKAPSLIGAARAQNLVTAAINWPVTIGTEANYLVPEFQLSPHPGARHMLDAISTPGLLEAAEISRGRPLPWPLDDEARADITRHVLKTYHPHLTVVHLLAVDGAQHDHGPDSPEGIRAIEEVDRQVGRIVSALDESGMRQRTTIALVSDHGFLPYERVLHPNALFKQEGLLQVNAAGTITSWQAYFHSSGGGGFVYLRDRADKALRARVEALLTKLETGPDSAIENLWNAADLAKAGAHPEAAFGLDVKNGWYTGAATESLITKVEGTRGGHGYAPQRPELHASLILKGPGIARRNLGVVRMTQVAPTLARILNVVLSPKADAPIVN
jgi:predicted AlkP superfamily pyrophosphatase or phosphodiesterase